MHDEHEVAESAASSRIPLYYTFGNHMHWVDMEWLWGYDVLPGSVRDMLAFCRATGARGNINFDAVGYEKMAAQAPDALAELKTAIAEGTIEVAGGSYAQPYGLFHGGESNIRQRLFGARAVRRLLGVWPKTFWEEEFDFFPQLPQILTSMGFRYASLFFQWTWHTPDVPRETTPAVWWEGHNGSRILTATRNALNLHQWPEDFAGLLESDAPRSMPAAGIQQWLELMPSPDWMCRSELMIPPMAKLMADSRFEIRPVTLPDYLEAARSYAEVRRYTLDDVFHGLSLGKNGDLLRKLSAAVEHSVLDAESVSTLTGFLGRPYPQWDVYPVWELDEAWRELMIAQHHDTDECEGLMGTISMQFYEKSLRMANHISARALQRISKPFGAENEGLIVFNTLGWERDAEVGDPALDAPFGVVRKLPPFGYRVVTQDQVESAAPCRVRTSDSEATFTRDDFSFTVNLKTGTVTQITSPDFPQGALADGIAIGEFTCRINGREETFRLESYELDEEGETVPVEFIYAGPGGSWASMLVDFAKTCDALVIDLDFGDLPRLDPGFAGALRWKLHANLDDYRLIHDHPYGVGEIEAAGSYARKYPTGDWMTSPQVFETVERPFTARSFLDFDAGSRGLLYCTGGNQSFLRSDDHVEQILNLYDPWDEDYFQRSGNLSVRVMPHGRLTNTKRWKLAQESIRPVGCAASGVRKGSAAASLRPGDLRLS
ncbi:MAG: hypothetical protein R2839_12755 [Thermomicrobiales bacterium]